ncbi:glycosyltransferase family 39 protein [Parageobacillus thermoglucosidasius]|uniref:Glycosyl transferase n=1 Tax=Parageobacillus thermoglucosidasius TaxID=1426 RepID=A0AAN1D7K2_PARTM|nr:glycosyltransferase family 39 protein [Parageobacillus thermoglucosidasius]REK58253.1 MAG: glycosyltransferase family 39 protein [Geobacillus sp.]ALF11228.1 glycosyl transferase [Parageobacillus thermoglucosidasius]ANZ31304.1 glycosyl transferase [Parageobacillus thermoglucosidasius]APM82042.1 glycosyl transferase [Parageobacillus thermoglucosidasius]EID44589.1 glycosyl transferase, family 39 [Parageobacillus thermoglucosidasius TNO-09.020]
MKSIKRVDGWLLVIVLISIFLHFYNIGNAGSNVYYTAAAKSMTANWKAFFFAALDPEGFITVDKPPVALWFQALSVAIFGVSDWSVLLPEALAGVGSTLLIYFIVKPFAGKAAARWASLIFVCTPIFVAVARTNNIDAILIFTLLVAAWALMKAIWKQRLSWLLASFALVGLGFNMKMLQAYMVLPAFYLFYWLAGKGAWKQRLWHLTAATAVVLAVSLSYAVIADMMPKDKRPYIGSSQTNSVLELALGYNGIDRLTGAAGPGGKRGMRGDNEFQDRNGQMNHSADPSSHSSLSNPSESGLYSRPNLNGEWPVGEFRTGGGQPPGGMGGIGRGETGQPGVFRLFQQQLAGQISWLLPFVLFTAVGLFASIRRQRAITPLHRFLLFWFAWLVPMAVFFSVAGFYHRYYLSMMAPAIAVLVAVGSELLWQFYKEQNGFWRWLFPGALLMTFLFESYVVFQQRSSLSTIWPLLLVLYGLAVFCFLLAFRQQKKVVHYLKIASLLGLLVMPFYWSLTPLLYGGNSSIPYAGPDLKRPDAYGQRVFGGREERKVTSDLLAYLEKHYNGEKYLAATMRANTAAELMLKTDKAVMAMGGFLGTDPVLTTEQLAKMARNGEVKYFLISGFGRGGEGNSELIQWIETHCQEVPQAEWQTNAETVKSWDEQEDEMPPVERGIKLYEYKG